MTTSMLHFYLPTVIISGRKGSPNASYDSPICVPLPHDGSDDDITAGQKTFSDPRQSSRGRFINRQRKDYFRKS